MADPHDVLRDIRRFLQRRSSEAVLLGEVNLAYPQQVAYFGADDGQELTMQFDFAGMQAFYLSLVRGDPAPLAAALTSRPGLPIEAQWAQFLRNPDALTLDQLSAAERQAVFEAIGRASGRDRVCLYV